MILNTQIILVLSIIFTSTCSADICNKSLHFLASQQKNFVYCATAHAVPVELCIGCEPNYSEMVASYIALRENVNCSNRYFDKDRINIVSTTHSILTGLWERAFCDDCFNSNNSFVFNAKLKSLEECFAESDTSKNICLYCLENYVDLNTFYTALDEKNNGKVCYDLQDSMNRTRSKWSKELKCCHRDYKILLFLITSGFVAILPILFYGSTFALTKHRERNHGILNEDPEFDSPFSSTSAATFPVLPDATHVAPASVTSDMSVGPSSTALAKTDDPQITIQPIDEDSDDSENDMYPKKQL